MDIAKSILITGGTGSFGKKFVETIVEKYPNLERIIIFSRDEFKHFEMSYLPFVQKYQKKIRFFVGDIRDKERLYRALDQVDIVVHAAALKQVPSCEYNPFEAVKTNVLGVQNVIDAAIDRGVRKVIALSTDKACEPVSLYGATKLCSDKLFIASNVYSKGSTKFSVVRYGNVVGSRGSVVPYFKALAKNGARYFPVTDDRMTRFWLKLEDAVGTVLQALDCMNGGELFVKRTPSMKITDLVRAIDEKLPIKKMGIRPGEKLHESMITTSDAQYTYEFNSYYVIVPPLGGEERKCVLKGARQVSESFEYHSGNNQEWLTISQMKQLISSIEEV